jgi:hypothetical protein
VEIGILTVELVLKYLHKETIRRLKGDEKAVLRFWDVYPGSQIRIFSIPDPGSRVRKIP